MKLLPLILTGFLLFGGCSERVLPPGGGTAGIGFELIYPHPVSDAVYYAAGGVRLSTTEVVTDTIILQTARSFYGQFYTNGVALPAKVELNNNAFERHLETDTLRLGSASNNSLFGIHTWQVTDSVPVKFIAPPMEELDDVAPLNLNTPIRGDTTLTLTWKGVPSHGVYLTWRAPNVETYTQRLNDNGQFTIPSAIVARFNGDSQMTLSRHRTEIGAYKGGKIYVTRIAQRDYKLSIFF